MPKPEKKYDWDALKTEFMEGEWSLKEFAELKNISYSYLRSEPTNWLFYRDKQQWIKYRIKYLETDKNYQAYREFCQLKFETAFDALKALNKRMGSDAKIKEILDVLEELGIGKVTLAKAKRVNK